VLSLWISFPVILLFVIAIGGIYAGVFTPTEGGAVGGVGALIMGAIMRRFSLRKIVDSCLEAGKLISMVFFIILGALMFGYFLAAQGLTTALQIALSSWHLAPVLVIVFICFVYLILGMLIDPIAMVLITLPIFFPVVMSLGYDRIWFGVLVVLFMNLGLITPPFGLNCFTAKGVVKDLSISTIFRGVIPFCLATLVAGVLIIAFPKIATFLPELLKLTW
jgi:tripartite ATP-independent transporter DctM subunit